MNEYDFGKAINEVRKDRIDIADKQVIEKFKRLPPASYSSEKRRFGQTKHTPARDECQPHRIRRGWLVALAGLLLLCLVIDAALICTSLLKDTVPAHLATQSVSSRAGVQVQHPMVINQTSIVERVVLGNTEDCTAIRWIENGVRKAKYVCEEKDEPK